MLTYFSDTVPVENGENIKMVMQHVLKNSDIPLCNVGVNMPTNLIVQATVAIHICTAAKGGREGDHSRAVFCTSLKFTNTMEKGSPC